MLEYKWVSKIVQISILVDENNTNRDTIVDKFLCDLVQFTNNMQSSISDFTGIFIS